MYTGRADVKFPPSTFFARNVLVAAPAMKIATNGAESVADGAISLHRFPFPDQRLPFPWLLC